MSVNNSRSFQIVLGLWSEKISVFSTNSEKNILIQVDMKIILCFYPWHIISHSVRGLLGHLIQERLTGTPEVILIISQAKLNH